MVGHHLAEHRQPAPRSAGSPAEEGPKPRSPFSTAERTSGSGAFSIVWEDVENVSNPVDFTPWLCSGNDTSVAIGFQPQVGCGDIVVTTNVANVGDANVTVQVIANSVANLYGVQAYFQYDSSKLNLSNIALGPGLLPEVNVATSQPGNQINFQFSQLSPTLPVTGSGIVLATLSFTATAPGVADIEFRPSATTLFSDNNGFSIGPATKTNGSITVSAPVSTGSVTGNILLQGRSNHSGATAQIDPLRWPDLARNHEHRCVHDQQRFNRSPSDAAGRDARLPQGRQAIHRCRGR
ncbi:MAG: hypothetical protein IPN07_14545 [Dehalococcoidia bacterium]|nr:hypothetical protein [Dehalococcoidia bacterium]